MDADSISVSQQEQWKELVKVGVPTYPLSDAFFTHWQQLSDKYAASYPCPNVSHVYQHAFMHYCDTNSNYSYYVLPPCVQVRKYSSEFDSKHYHSYWSVEDYFKKTKEFTYVPHLYTDKPVLYLFDGIEKVLGEYLGGVKVECGRDINKEHVDDLQQYIEFHYGHWGGYWHMETMPIIFQMYFFCNGVFVSIRDSWCTGREVFMPYKSNEFIEIEDWIE